MNKHLTTDELVNRLYGVEDAGHLAQCAECTARLQRLAQRRAMVTEQPAASDEFLAAQRRSIHARLEERPQRLKWVPALAAAACLVAVGVATTTYNPAPIVPQIAAQTVKPEIDDAQLFSDVYSMEQSMEPLAAQPIHGLFEQEQQ
jgi:anti-sigma factor RsiW